MVSQMSDSEAGKLPSSQCTVARLFHASERSGAISISLVKVSTALFSSLLLHLGDAAHHQLALLGIGRPWSIAPRSPPPGTGWPWDRSRSAAWRTGCRAWSLLPPFCADTFAPSITPSKHGKASAKEGHGVLNGRAAGFGPPVAQSSSSTVCTIGMPVPRRDIADAAEIAGGDDVGPQALDVGHLAVAQAARQLGLQHLVGAGPAAAEMALRHVLHDEARVAQQLLGLLDHFLAVLHGTGRMIGHGERPSRSRSRDRPRA